MILHGILGQRRFGLHIWKVHTILHNYEHVSVVTAKFADQVPIDVVS